MNAISRRIDRREFVERDLIDFAEAVAKMLRAQQYPKTHGARIGAELDVVLKIKIILRRRAIREGGAL